MRPVVQEEFAEAVRHYQAGRWVEASQLARKILKVEPGHADSLQMLGLIAYQDGRFDVAVALIDQAIRRGKDNPVGRYNLGNALRAMGRTADAAAQYQRALVLQPDYPAAHNNLGIVLAEQGRRAEAVVHYERALALQPDLADAHNNLAIALAEQGRTADAVAHYERALALHPDDANAHNNLGAALATLGRPADAVTHYERALSLKPDHASAHSNLGVLLREQNRLEDAMAHLRRALAVNPDHADAQNNLGIIHKDRGEFDEAVAHYNRAIAIKPDYAEAHFNRSEIKTFHQGDADLAALEALAARGDLPASKAPYVQFALAKALEDCGNYGRAWAHLRQGNALKRRQISYDEGATLQLFRRISTVFDRSLFARFPATGDSSSVPIFVLGMPRSGSTLIEQILAGHPQIFGAGELPDLEIAARGAFPAGDHSVPYPERAPALDGAAWGRLGRSYLARLPTPADGQTRIVDKSPSNFLHLGLIRLILPNAKIIHTVRHPLDTCVSCYSKLFTSGMHYSYDLAELGRYYRHYRELMVHWKSVLPSDAMLDVAYEDVVDDLEGQARRLIEYCGLPWDDRCLGFHRNPRPVKTASAVSVRQPLFRSSLQRWRRYEAGLAPLRDELGAGIPDGPPPAP